MPKVKATIGSKVKLCLNLCCSYTTEANLIKLLMRRCVTLMILVPMPKVKVAVRSEVKIMSQQ